MGRFLDSLKAPSPFFEVEETETGMLLRGAGEAFDNVVRAAIEASGEDFVALPTTDGSTGYDRCLIIPI